MGFLPVRGSCPPVGEGNHERQRRSSTARAPPRQNDLNLVTAWGRLMAQKPTQTVPLILAKHRLF
jgi:hypothetical protein